MRVDACCGRLLAQGAHALAARSARMLICSALRTALELAQTVLALAAALERRQRPAATAVLRTPALLRAEKVRQVWPKSSATVQCSWPSL
eukprot:6186490-Pleurochrysis_carterae.AAC.1